MNSVGRAAARRGPSLAMKTSAARVSRCASQNARRARFLAGLDQPGGVESQLAVARPQDFAQRRQVDGVLALVVGGAAAVPAVALDPQAPGIAAGVPFGRVAAHHVAVAV
jgi:hypothetical protein